MKLPEPPPPTLRLRLDREALAANWRALDRLSGAAAAGAAVKADAYGLGVDTVVPALLAAGARDFFVAHWSEVPAVLRHLEPSRLAVLHGPLRGEDAQFARATGVRPVINSLHQARLWLDAGGGACDLMVDSGINRLGLPVNEIGDPLVAALEIDTLLSHLASADEDEIATARQLDLFDEAIARLETLGVRPPFIHAANSAGMACVRDNHTAVRPGLLLYGLSPRPRSPEIPVRPAMELRARVALVKRVSAGTRVSYGGKFVAEKDIPLATINAGYADGIPRTDAMRTKGALRHRGADLPVAGTVCMDLTMLDASRAPALAAGDEVTVFGDAPSAWDLAGWAGTNAWQILTGVGSRVPRRYLRGGGAV